MFYLSKNPEKVFQVPKKTNDNKSECFLEDHVTEDWSNDCWKFSFASQE